jgi:hypothetical protein
VGRIEKFYYIVNKKFKTKIKFREKIMQDVIFDTADTELKSLLIRVRDGSLGLPDLQRPFVWQNNKVRDLLDSMMKGYPIGFVMTWQCPIEQKDKKSFIGIQEKDYKEPSEVIIDGQQRLTALYAAMFGVTIKDKNFAERKIEISYNPSIRKFEVSTPAFKKSSEWIGNISELFLAKENNKLERYKRNYIERLNEERLKRNLEIITEDELDNIYSNIDDLLNLDRYKLPSVRINASAKEEDVADIFVRVNSGGQKLNENDFILTLISVYEKETRETIDNFCEKSRKAESNTSYNLIMEVDPSHLVKMAIGYGFRRARLKYAYMLLRGKDLQTGDISHDIRTVNLGKFKESLSTVINLNNWHNYLNMIAETGYVSNKIIASSNALVYTYVMYLIAKYDYKLNPSPLKFCIRKWFFMSSITYMYSGSPESVCEKVFADLRNIKNDKDFIQYINEYIESRMTDDYFNITLPRELETSASISPAWFGYIASQNIMGTTILFGNTQLASYLVPGMSGTKNAIDKHHIFPKNYLAKIGIIDDRDRNQVANFTYLDYNTNIEISDTEPTNYVSNMKEKFGLERYDLYCQQHSLPKDFETMNYFDFLKQRRKQMALLIKKAYHEICR